MASNPGSEQPHPPTQNAPSTSFPSAPAPHNNELYARQPPLEHSLSQEQYAQSAQNLAWPQNEHPTFAPLTQQSWTPEQQLWTPEEQQHSVHYLLGLCEGRLEAEARLKRPDYPASSTRQHWTQAQRWASVDAWAVNGLLQCGEGIYWEGKIVATCQLSHTPNLHDDQFATLDWHSRHGLTRPSLVEDAPVMPTISSTQLNQSSGQNEARYQPAPSQSHQSSAEETSTRLHRHHQSNIATAAASTTGRHDADNDMRMITTTAPAQAADEPPFIQCRHCGDRHREGRCRLCTYCGIRHTLQFCGKKQADLARLESLNRPRPAQQVEHSAGARQRSAAAMPLQRPGSALPAARQPQYQQQQQQQQQQLQATVLNMRDMADDLLQRFGQNPRNAAFSSQHNQKRERSLSWSVDEDAASGHGEGPEHKRRRRRRGRRGRGGGGGQQEQQQSMSGGSTAPSQHDVYGSMRRL